MIEERISAACANGATVRASTNPSKVFMGLLLCWDGPVARPVASTCPAAPTRPSPRSQLRPDHPAVDGDGGHHSRLERHPPTALRGQLLRGQEVADPVEDQLAVLHSPGAHPAEAHAGDAAPVLGEHDLAGRQRHGLAVGEDTNVPGGPFWTMGSSPATSGSR
jgi:hypothetical protein